jgi:2-phospho-L-lactate transferase/gluconeogenesis factor (CofD/UPF0052 family)
VLVANLVSERGEASGMNLADHLEMIEKHAGRGSIDVVLVNDAPIPADVLERYEVEGTTPLCWPESELRGVPVVRRPLLAKGAKLRHDPGATAEGVIAAWSMMKALTRFRVAER